MTSHCSSVRKERHMADFTAISQLEFVTHQGWKRQLKPNEAGNEYQQHKKYKDQELYLTFSVQTLPSAGCPEKNQPVDSHNDNDTLYSSDSDLTNQYCVLVDTQVEEEIDKIRPKDIGEGEVLDECITCIICVTKDLVSERVSKILVYVVGAIESVENCNEIIGKAAVCVRTIWIYNKNFRQELTAAWEAMNFSLNQVLPHIAYASAGNLLPKISENSLIFETGLIKVVHRFSQTSGPRKLSKTNGPYSWEVVVNTDGSDETVSQIETNTQEMRPVQTRDWAEKAASTLQNASAYLSDSPGTHNVHTGSQTQPRNSGRSDGSANPKKKSSGASNYDDVDNRSTSVIATMSFTKFHSGKNAATIILSLGDQSQIVTMVNENNNNAAKQNTAMMVTDVKELLSDARRRLGVRKQWYIYTCKLEGTLEDIHKVADFIRCEWSSSRHHPKLDDIACHALFIHNVDQTGFPSLIPLHFSSDTTVRFQGLKKLCKQKESHIDCYSHLPRPEALHSFFYARNADDYKTEWDALKIRNDAALKRFYDKHYTRSKTDSLGEHDAVSFFYPSIQFGWRTGRDDHTTYFQNNESGTKHHRFVSEMFTETYKTEFNRSQYLSCLLAFKRSDR